MKGKTSGHILRRHSVFIIKLDGDSLMSMRLDPTYVTVVHVPVCHVPVRCFVQNYHLFYIMILFTISFMIML